MTKFSKEGLRFIIAVLVLAVTLIVAASIFTSGFREVARSIREQNEVIKNQDNNNVVTNPDEEIITFRVDFNPMGGTLTQGAPSFLQVKLGNNVVNFPAVTLAGHTFIGWYTGVTPSDVLFTADTPVVQDITLFARFVETPVEVVVEEGTETFRVAFESNGGLPVNSIQVPKFSSFSLPITTRDTYVFLGWFTGNLPGDVLVTSQTVITRDMTLVARWERAHYLLTFLSNGGSFVEPIQQQGLEAIHAPVNPKRLNHTFEGWYLDQMYTMPFNFTTMPLQNTTVYAKWSVGTDEGVQYVFSSTEAIVIGFDAFHTSIIIPEFKNGLPVTTIADEAFINQKTLIEVTIEGQTLQSIGRSAFEGTSVLRSINIPESVLSIKQSAFKNASSLVSLTIGNQVQTLGRGIIEGADGLQTVTVPFFGNDPQSQPQTLKFYFGGTTFDSLALIPLSLKDVYISEGVEIVPNDAFRNLNTLRSIHLPSSILTVGTNVLTGTRITNLTWTFTSTTLTTGNNSYLAYAFGGAQSNIATQVPITLKHVTINQTNITEISSAAFYNIASIETIVLPENIKSIGTYAFAHQATGTSQLKTIVLPEGLLNINAFAFQNSSSLQSFTIPNGTSVAGNVLSGALNLKSLSVGGNINLFLRYYFGGTSATAGGVIPTALETVTFTSVTGNTIPASYFSGFSTLITINLPEGITTLGNDAFFNTTSLKNITLPNTVTTLGTRIFGNSGIETMVIPSGVTVINTDTFSGASSLSSVTLPDGLTTINANAFLNTRLKTLTLPNTVTTIGASAFQGNTELVTVVIPSSVTTLGINVFSGNTKLENVTVTLESLPVASRFFRYLFGGTTAIAGGVLPTNLLTATLNSTALDTIPVSFFQGFATLETVTLSDTFTKALGSVFNGAVRLREVNLPKSLTEISASMFLGTSQLLNLTLPETIVSIGANAFQNSGITQLEIPQGVTTILNDTFNGAASLISVKLPEGLISIGTNAFLNTRLTTLTLPNTVTTIGASAFQGNTELVTVVISSSVTTLGTNVFNGNTKLENVTLTLESLPVASRFFRYLFGGTTAIAGGVLPTNLKTATLNSTALDTIPTSFFQGFTTLETVTLSDTFTKALASTFQGATSLKTVKLPANLTEISPNMFFGTTLLEQLTVPQTVTLVGASAFQGSGIKQLEFKGTLTTIGMSAFSTTTSLEAIYFHQVTLPSLGTTIFGTPVSSTLKIYVISEEVKTLFAANAQFAPIQTNGNILVFNPNEAAGN